jgi:hypothetical protein
VRLEKTSILLKILQVSNVIKKNKAQKSEKNGRNTGSKAGRSKIRELVFLFDDGEFTFIVNVNSQTNRCVAEMPKH